MWLSGNLQNGGFNEGGTYMPKLNRPPKYCKDGRYAAVYLHGKTHYLGLHGSPVALTAYNRFCTEIQSNPTFVLRSSESGITVQELVAAFLDHAKATLKAPNYTHYRIVVVDFLLTLYGDGTPADAFKPSSLKLLREKMIQSGRFCRKQINEYTRRIIALFTWGGYGLLILITFRFGVKYRPIS